MKRLRVLKPQPFRRKKDTAPDTGHDIYLRTCQVFLYLHWVSSSGKIMWRSHTCILRNTFKGFGTNSSPTTTIPAERRDMNYGKVHASLSFVSGEIQKQWAPTWRPDLKLLLPSLQGCSPPTDVTKFSHRMDTVWCTDLPYQTHAEQTLLPKP